MLYQLKNGRTVDISVYQAMEMTDEDLEYLNAYWVGDIVENPFHGSVLNHLTDDKIDFIIEEILEDVPDVELDIDPDLTEE